MGEDRRVERGQERRREMGEERRVRDHHYTYAVERAALLAQEHSRPGSLSSLSSQLSITSGYASLPSDAARVGDTVYYTTT